MIEIHVLKHFSKSSFPWSNFLLHFRKSVNQFIVKIRNTTEIHESIYKCKEKWVLSLSFLIIPRKEIWTDWLYRSLALIALNDFHNSKHQIITQTSRTIMKIIIVSMNKITMKKLKLETILRRITIEIKFSGVFDTIVISNMRLVSTPHNTKLHYQSYKPPSIFIIGIYLFCTKSKTWQWIKDTSWSHIKWVFKLFNPLPT